MLRARRLAVLPLVALVLVALPSAASARETRSATSQGIGAGIATGIATEVAKQGAKALILHFAPQLQKDIDPTAYALAQIQEQLAQLDAKLTQLADHQRALGNTLGCKIQTSDLQDEVSAAQTSLASFVAASSLKNQGDRVAQLDALYPQLFKLATDQRTIHNTLVDGALIDCAKHIEDGMAPYLSSALADYVRDFYATYKSAELALFLVRANLMNYDALVPGTTATRRVQYSEAQVQTAAANTTEWIKHEEGLIKPAFPDTQSYDKRTDTLFKVRMVTDAADRKFLLDHEWLVTGYSYIPTCSAIQHFVDGSGRSGYDALAYLKQINVLDASPVIQCYDDHDNHELYDLTRRYYSDGRPGYPSIAAIKHRIYPIISEYSYTG